MAVKKVKAAPAAKTPFLRVSHDGGFSPMKALYFVWYAFLAEAANKHTSATMKVSLKWKIDKIDCKDSGNLRRKFLVKVKLIKAVMIKVILH